MIDFTMHYSVLCAIKNIRVLDVRVAFIRPAIRINN